MKDLSVKDDLVRHLRFVSRLMSGWLAASAVMAPTVVSADRSLPPLAEIRKQVVENHDRVTSIEVTYETVPVRGVGKFSHSRHTVSQKGRLRFAENVHFSKRAEPGMDLNHTKMYFTGGTFDVFFVNTRYYETSKRNATKAYPWKLRVDSLLVAVGWWPSGDESPPDVSTVTPFRPLRFLLADPACRIESGETDGAPCVVVGRPGRERVWLDPGLGYAVRRHEVFHPKTGELAVQATLTGLTPNDLPGGHRLWFPAMVRLERFDPTQPNTESSRVVELRIERIELNQVRDDRFVFRPPPGTMIQNRDTQAVSLIPGGFDLIDHSVQIARRLADPTVGPNSSVNWRTVSWAVAGGLVLACIGVLLSWRGSRTTQPAS